MNPFNASGSFVEGNLVQSQRERLLSGLIEIIRGEFHGTCRAIKMTDRREASRAKLARFV